MADYELYYEDFSVDLSNDDYDDLFGYRIDSSINFFDEGLNYFYQFYANTSNGRCSSQDLIDENKVVYTHRGIVCLFSHKSDVFREYGETEILEYDKWLDEFRLLSLWSKSKEDDDIKELFDDEIKYYCDYRNGQYNEYIRFYFDKCDEVVGFAFMCGDVSLMLYSRMAYINVGTYIFRQSILKCDKCICDHLKEFTVHFGEEAVNFKELFIEEKNYFFKKLISLNKNKHNEECNRLLHMLIDSTLTKHFENYSLQDGSKMVKLCINKLENDKSVVNIFNMLATAIVNFYVSVAQELFINSIEQYQFLKASINKIKLINSDDGKTQWETLEEELSDFTQVEDEDDDEFEDLEDLDDLDDEYNKKHEQMLNEEIACKKIEYSTDSENLDDLDDEYNKKHEQMLNEKITCKKIKYSTDSEKQKILTADYEKFLMTFNADTSKYLNRYKSVANSYSQINELLDIKSEEREFSKIIKHLCVEILQCNDDDKKLITNEQLKLAEELASVYEQKKSIDKDDFIALSNKNNFLYDDKSEDEMINVVLKEKDASSYITVSKRLKNTNPVYALLFAVKHCIYSDKYIDDNGKLCDMTPYIGELGNDMYVQPVYYGFVMYNDKWKELLSGKKSIEIDDVNQILKEFTYIGDLKYVIDKFCNSIHNYNDYEVIATFINKMYEKKQRLIKETERNKEVYDAFGILSTEIGNDFSIKNRAKFLHLLNEKQYSNDIQNSLLKIAEEKFNESLFLTIEKFMDDVEKECSIKFCFNRSLLLKKYHSYSEENRAKILPSYLSSLEEAKELFIHDAKENYDLFILFFTIKRLHSGEKQGFALTNKGLIYTNEQNQNCMVKYESIISFELTSEFLSTNLIMVTNDGELIELKNDFNSDTLNNAPVYIKSMIKEISASDIYIGNQENIINAVTTQSNDTINNNDNIKTNENDLVQSIKHDTEEKTDEVSAEKIDITSLSEILKSYFASHVAKGTATASSKLISGLSLPSDCEIYYAQDSTLFGSGKNGFAVTNKGIYTRKMFEKNVLIRPLEVLKTAKKFSADKSTPGLLLDGEFFVECSMAENLVPLFNGLIDYLHKYKIECDNSEKVTDKQLKYCPECGTPTKIQAKFCSKCGHKF